MLTRLLRPRLARYRTPLVIVIALTVAQTVANLYLPNLNAEIINHGVVTGDLAYIERTGAVMLILAVGLGGLAIAAVWFASRVSMGVGADLRADVFRAVSRLSSAEVARLGTASLITRNTNDVQQIQLLLQIALTVMIMAPVLAVGGVLMAISESAHLSLLLAVSIPVMAIVVAIMLSMALPSFRSMQTRIDRVNQVLREQIMGVRVIRAFVRGPHETRRFGEANEALTATALRVNRVFAAGLPSVMAVLNLSSVAVIWFGGRLVAGGTLPIGNMTAFLTYIMLILMGVMMAVMMAILIPRAVACAERIGEVLDVEPSIADPPAPRRPGRVAGRVELDRVTFGYPGGERPVLNGLDFSIEPGTTTALIGGTGSGKTTLVNLVTRLLEASAGRVVIDGLDVRERALEELWATIGLVPQAAFLFSGTVAGNLRLGRPDATDADLWRALRVAQAADFVADMPGGLVAPIDQGGTNVSGGQRQRLAIARALVKRPALLLFDDCFSALDATTDARVRAALEEEVGDTTRLVVAQRVSTIMEASRIVVLDQGVVVGVGAHADLLATCPTYAEIVVSQLGQGAAP